MPVAHKPKIMFQSDFDGTLTEGDVSFLILEKYAQGDWCAILREYQEGKISVGDFNYRAFALVKEDRETLVDFIRKNAIPKKGIYELINYCRQEDIRFSVVSNGLDFYIHTMLEEMGFKDIEINAARTLITSNGLDARYYGPDGKMVENGFKESYTNHYKSQNYQVIYAGNGPSDFPPAKLCEYAFATDMLLDRFKQNNLPCYPFQDLHDIVSHLKALPR